MDQDAFFVERRGRIVGCRTLNQRVMGSNPGEGTVWYLWACIPYILMEFHNIYTYCMSLIKRVMQLEFNFLYINKS
jgi:hypothetical protein